MVRGEVLDVAAEAVVDFEHDEAHAYCVDHLLRHPSCISHYCSYSSVSLLCPTRQRGVVGRAQLTCVRAMTASSQPKLRVIHILVINLKHTRIVAGPKTAQLTPMSMGPRFLSPTEGIISALSIAATGDTEPTLGPVRAATVQSSLEN